MKKILYILTVTILHLTSNAQNSTDDPSLYYSLGKHYYDNQDYLTAYKYLLGYKFLNYQKLNNSEYSSTLSNLNKVINYCEAQLRKGISESSTFNRRGWSEPKIDSINTIVKSAPPKLPPNKIESTF